MTWWKGEDSWDDSEAFNDVPDAAVALYFRGQARMARLLSDGVLSTADLERIDLSRPPAERRRAPWRRLVVILEERGLLVRDGDRWRDPGWLVRNPSRIEVEGLRRWNALRQQLRYARGRGASAEIVTALEAEAKAAHRDLLESRGRRTSRTLTSEITGELRREVTSDLNVPRPVPSRPVDEDEDEGAPASLVAPEARSAGASEEPTDPVSVALAARGVALRSMGDVRAVNALRDRLGEAWLERTILEATPGTNVLAHAIAQAAGVTGGTHGAGSKANAGEAAIASGASAPSSPLRASSAVPSCQPRPRRNGSAIALAGKEAH